jgi:hypothetical protein
MRYDQWFSYLATGVVIFFWVAVTVVIAAFCISFVV